MSGNVKLDPGPMKKCPKCEKIMPTRSNNCKYGYLLCCVGVRVLHFSAFITFMNYLSLSLNYYTVKHKHVMKANLHVQYNINSLN